MKSDRQSDSRSGDMSVASPELKAWFVREVLPLEAALIGLLRRSVRNQNDIDDLSQDIYVRIYEAARREQVVPIEAIANLNALGVALDAPEPDQALIARDELRTQVRAVRGGPDIHHFFVGNRPRKIVAGARVLLHCQYATALSYARKYFLQSG